jgi:mycoredoxin-dependent peroxiredoxin
MAIETGSEAPEFDLEVDKTTRVRLSDFRGRRNVLLVFHPFAFTPVCEEEARDLQENLPAFESAETEVILVSCDPSASRQAWKQALGLTYTLASDFWPHGAAAQAYEVFDETCGAPIRGTFLIDKSGVVVWKLVNRSDERREELVSGPLGVAR